MIDRATAAREIARVLRPGGRFVAAVWASPEECDLVLFQQTAGKFAPKPPVPGVGPGALADPKSFLAELKVAGINASVETEVIEFQFDNFASAWEIMARVKTSGLERGRRGSSLTFPLFARRVYRGRVRIRLRTSGRRFS